MIDRPYRIGAVLFDFDGTLTRPGALDFAAIRRELGCPPDRPILEYIEALPSEARRRDARQRLDAREMAAAAASVPADGAEDLVLALTARRVPCAILTRNTRRAVDRALANFRHLGPGHFREIITRDTPVAPKPSGDGVRLAARRLGVPPEQLLVVGDYVFDTEAGRRAGALTAFVSRPGGPPAPPCDVAVDALAALSDFIRMGLALRPGKLPNDLLERFLDHFELADPSLVVRPGVGQDTAAVDLAGADTLVLTSDPITFATDRIGRYAVLVNANDMATSGAVPRWLLVTLMFPCGATPAEVWRVMHDLDTECRRHGITLCGGHTEITAAVSRPVVVGSMAGTLMRPRLMDKRALSPGDRLLLTKAVAVEGTAIIAREFGARLREEGLEADVLQRARDLLSRMSVLEEAAVCRDTPGVTALHDVTEGGLATAVQELAVAGGCGVHVWRDRVPVYDETRRICNLVGIDPFGLIGSGSLLIACRPEAAPDLERRLVRAGVAVTGIGVVGPPAGGVTAEAGGAAVPWPAFEVDEITRLFAEASDRS